MIIQKKKKKREPIITDPSLLTNNYPNLLDEYGKESEITITNLGLTGTMIIDGYQGRKINVGNNFLSYFYIKNCPNLTTLRYAYNGLLHDAWIDEKTCPNLTIIDKHKYDDPNWHKELKDLSFNKEELISTGKEKFNEKLNQAHEFKQQFNDRVKNLLDKIDQGVINGFQEFINTYQNIESFESVFARLNEDNQQKFTNFFVPKLEEKVKELINDYSESQHRQFLTEVAKLKPFFAYLSAETKQELTKLMKSLQASLETTPQPNYWLWIISGIVITPIVLGLLLLLTNKLVKKFLKLVILY